MKKLTGMIFYLLIMTGCTEKAAEVAEVEPVAEPETAEEMALFEYMWCDFGPGTTEEAMAELTAEFNEITSGSTHKVSSAWGYIPSFETDLYDAIWLNVWADEETRNAGWAEWQENSAE